MIRNLASLALVIACTHQPAVVGGDIAVDAVSTVVRGKTLYGAAVSTFDPDLSLLWYAMVYTGTPADVDEIRRTYVPRLLIVKNEETIAGFELSGRTLFVIRNTVRAATEAEGRAKLLSEIAPRNIASSHPDLLVLPKDTIAIDIYEVLGYDFTDGTFHELPRTKLLSARFEEGEWRLEIQNGRGETRLLRLDRDFKPVKRAAT